MVSVETCYLSAGCNTCPHSADWGRNGFICYAYSRAIAIYRPKGEQAEAKVLETVTGHTDRVNCVTWVKNGLHGETEFVSGSVDGTARVWAFSASQVHAEPVSVLEGHGGSVISVSACRVPSPGELDAREEEQTLIVTSSADSTVRIWKKGSDTKEHQVLHFGSGFALTVGLFVIPEINVPLLACGCDDSKIHLYVPDAKEKFLRLTSLSGHEDWVRSVNFVAADNGDLLLASGSQDHQIRVWKLEHHFTETPVQADTWSKETNISFTTETGRKVHLTISLESVLSGHEGWVYSVKWQPTIVLEDGSTHQPIKLLSASMDKTMIIWAPDDDTGVWVERVRVGDMGGNTLGFYGGLISPCGLSVFGHGYHGGFQQWTYSQASSRWEPQVTGGGHFSSVVDLTWSGDTGHYLLSTSTDQTTRLHAPWVQNKQPPCWFELGRPQIHGFDMQCLAALGKYSFASGADEKLIRIFRAPKIVIKNLCQICGQDPEKVLESMECLSLPEGANVPALGLSNKAVYHVGSRQHECHSNGQYCEQYFTPIDLIAPPSEDQLQQLTLWPEEAKLYGHGYQIFSLAANPQGNLLASACKATTAEAASIFIWDLSTKKIISTLSGLTLTVTQQAFNHEGNLLLAVSRDRTWALYRKLDDGQFALAASVDKKTSSHARLIWSCAWSHDDTYFFTASRDKKVLAWSLNEVTKCQPPLPVASLTCAHSVTAVALAPSFIHYNKYLIAVGLESGQLLLYTWLGDGQELTLVSSLHQRQAHHLTITRLAFRPHTGRLGHEINDDSWLQLASCGEDQAVRVYNINLSLLS